MKRNPSKGVSTERGSDRVESSRNLDAHIKRDQVTTAPGTDLVNQVKTQRPLPLPVLTMLDFAVDFAPETSRAVERD